MRNYHKNMDKRMFDFEDFYQKVAEQLPSPCVIADVGIADAAPAIFLAEALINLKKDFKLHLVDSLSYGGSDQLATILYHIVESRIGKRVQIHPYPSLEASCRFADAHFDFVFIDASHRYEHTKADIRLWWQKIKHEGLLAGHDYNDTPEGVEVKTAVDLVVPAEILEVHETSKKLGVWAVRRDIGLATVMK